MTGTLSNPTIGEQNSAGDPKIVALVKQFNEKLDSSNTLPDTSLSSPNNSTYKTIFSARQSIQTDRVAGTYILCNRTGTAAGAVASGENILGGGEAPGVPYFYFDDADYTVAGKTTKLRIRAQIATNATKPIITFTLALYPITIAGGADLLTMTLGTLVPNSKAEFSEPPASTVSTVTSSQFEVPADGAYALGVVTNGTMTNNSAALLSAQLQVRNT